jgi:hypothetical protein
LRCPSGQGRERSNATAADVTRRRKLLEKQKEEGKERVSQFGKVDIPQETFVAALKIDVWRSDWFAGLSPTQCAL